MEIPFNSFFSQLWGAGKLIVVVILIVGSVRHLHEESRVQLEGKNLELQRAVDIGNTRSKQQEQELDKREKFRKDSCPRRFPR